MTHHVQVLRPVIFVGENPNLTLYGPAGGATPVMTASASFWRCGWSPAGRATC